MDNNEDDIDQLNLGDEEVKVDLYNENNENENENDNNDNNNSLEKSKNDNQLSYRYTIVDKNFDEDNSRENSIRSNKSNKDNSNLMNDNDIIINDSGAHSKRESKNIEKVSISFINLKVILLGDSGVGKTSIIGRYIDSSFKDDYKATIQVESRIKIINEDDKTSIKLNIWDTAGQEKFRAITRQFYRDCQGAFIVFDLSRKNSFNEVRNWIDELKTHGNNETVMMILGNKSDLTNEREVFDEDIKNEFQNKYKYFEVSAKNGNNVSLAFDELKKLMMQNLNKTNKNSLNENYNTKGNKKKLNTENNKRAQSLEDISKTINKNDSKKCC
jgi:small GTP-binding protein